MILKNGDVFEGIYAEDRWTGEDEGTLRHKDCAVFTGTFLQGRKYNGITIYSDGRPAETVVNGITLSG